MSTPRRRRRLTLTSATWHRRSTGDSPCYEHAAPAPDKRCQLRSFEDERPHGVPIRQVVRTRRRIERGRPELVAHVEAKILRHIILRIVEIHESAEEPIRIQTVSALEDHAVICPGADLRGVIRNRAADFGVTGIRSRGWRLQREKWARVFLEMLRP